MIETEERKKETFLHRKTSSNKNNSAVLSHPSKNAELKVSWVNITPELATELLEKNYTQNRKIKPKVVDNYTEQLNLGLWKESSAESIKISSSGMLIDGQHRLSAVVQSGVTVAMLVVENIPDDAISAIDDGSKRTLSDSILISGLENKNFNQKIIAATIIGLEVIQKSFIQDRRIKSIKKNRNSSVTSTLEFAKRLTNLYNIVDDFMINFNTNSIKKFIPLGASSIPIYYVFSQVDKEFTDNFFKTIQTGIPHDELGANSPSFIVYNAIIGYKLRGIPLSLGDYFEMFVWAMNKTKMNSKVKSVYRKKDFLISDNYANSDKVAALLREI
jgi:hypothetical protein